MDGADNKTNIKYNKNINKTLKVKLTTTKEQSKALLSTMEQFNEACNWISRKSFEAEVFRQVELHHLVYFEARERFPSLTSQMVIRAIAKVSDSYKPEKESLHSFRKYSAMEYDKRLLSFKSLSHASIATIHGRIAVP
ncbi:MAG: hypothetical protein ACYCSV_12225, partial [Leptospirillum sp.]